MESFTLPFQLAADFINGTNRAVFLTGKAGTGKTTFLKHIKQHIPKQTAVIAPTGVAAINAGGSTIHSFFQLPFSPYLPEAKGTTLSNAVCGKNDLIGRIKLNTKRRKVLQELELLIIDEISMVRCDTLDAVDVILRHVRHRPNEPFGGVQILLIGDIFQLSPVAVQHEWNELRQYYNSPYFFHSRVMMQIPPIYIELDKIYRQKNEDFIKVLNEVRNNNLSPEGYLLLQKRYDPEFSPPGDENYITLCTHNSIANSINIRELANVPGKVITFNAAIKGEYPENSYPIDKELQLKIGAKVMFIKNDLEQDKRFYNGKIGVIVFMDKDTIGVQCPNEPEPIIVSQYVWENIKTEVDTVTHQLDEKIIGTFQQFPLRLAWAITIHKSQGLTFEKAIIDAGKAFAPGQVYVALSRCTSLEGLVLKSPINSGSLSNDQHILHYSSSKPAVEEIQEFLSKEKKQFHQQLLYQLFDYGFCQNSVANILTYIQANKESFNAETEEFIQGLQGKINELQLTAHKFQIQLRGLYTGVSHIRDELQSRITAASNYFKDKVAELILLINQSVAETDSKLHAQTFNDALNDLFIVFAQKQHIMLRIHESYSVEEFYKARRSFIVPKFKVNAYSGKKNEITGPSVSAHPHLLMELKSLRNQICEAKDLPVYMVASTSTLDELANYLPITLDDLSRISGFGTAKVESYGQRFLDIIAEYCSRNNLTTLMHTKPGKVARKQKSLKEKVSKADTKSISFQYFKSGKSLTEIAEMRNLTTGTIHGHLAYYVVSGKLDLYELINEEKVVLIEDALKKSREDNLNSLKHKLGDRVSYDEIRLVSILHKEKQSLDSEHA
ncbi:AAA family ATPase [Flavihumibacter sp. R14]|nr:AAA family ATPase [Flavihumibacter soli]